jgi:hypothetical protein
LGRAAAFTGRKSKTTNIVQLVKPLLPLFRRCAVPIAVTLWENVIAISPSVRKSQAGAKEVAFHFSANLPTPAMQPDS